MDAAHEGHHVHAHGDHRANGRQTQFWSGCQRQLFQAHQGFFHGSAVDGGHGFAAQAGRFEELQRFRADHLPDQDGGRVHAGVDDIKHPIEGYPGRAFGQLRRRNGTQQEWMLDVQFAEGLRAPQPVPTRARNRRAH